MIDFEKWIYSTQLKIICVARCGLVNRINLKCWTLADNLISLLHVNYSHQNYVNLTL